MLFRSSLKVMTNKSNDKRAPNIVGQAGDEKFAEVFGHLMDDGEVVNKTTIKKTVLNNISEMIPIYLDYLFICDINLWFYMDGEKWVYKIFRPENYQDFKWDNNLISFTKTDTWEYSTTVKYEGCSLGECQFHKNRQGFKFRFHLKNLLEILSRLKINNETLGITAEKVICEISNLKFDAHVEERALPSLETKLKDILFKAVQLIPTPVRYVGSEAGDRGEQSKSKVDFFLEDSKTLSLKTNWGRMVCPPEVGQPNDQTFQKYFGHLMTEDFSDEEFKKVCLNKINLMIPIYLEHLLDCDFILWIYATNARTTFEYKIVDCNQIRSIIWNKDLFEFTQTAESWNESCSVRYNGVSLGSFQIHSNRKCYKFRFNFPNLLCLLR